MISHKLPDQACSETLATMRRMCTDAADLRVAVEHQALAAHRDQFAARPNAVIRPHFARPVAKETGERKSCERNHLPCIRVGKLNNFHFRIDWRYFLREHHLKALQSVLD